MYCNTFIQSSMVFLFFVLHFMVEKLRMSLTLCYQSIKYRMENEKAHFLKVLKVIF